MLGQNFPRPMFFEAPFYTLIMGKIFNDPFKHIYFTLIYRFSQG